MAGAASDAALTPLTVSSIGDALGGGGSDAPGVDVAAAMMMPVFHVCHDPVVSAAVLPSFREEAEAAGDPDARAWGAGAAAKPTRGTAGDERSIRPSVGLLVRTSKRARCAQGARGRRRSRRVR